MNAEGATKPEKRQSINAFDHNPDGSQFLWVLQDTYEGKTFFECVIIRRANRFRLLTFLTVDGPFSQERIQPSKSCRSHLTEVTVGNTCAFNPPAGK